MQRFGYRVIPVTPSAPAVLGERSVPDLDHLGDVLAPGEKVDIVDVFRRPEHVAAIVDGLHPAAAAGVVAAGRRGRRGRRARARAAGLRVVMDRCIFRDRAALR